MLKRVTLGKVLLAGIIFLFPHAVVPSLSEAAGGEAGGAFSTSDADGTDAGSEDFGGLLKSKGARPMDQTGGKETLQGIHMEGKVRESLWYQSHSPNSWKTSLRLDAALERSQGPLRLRADLRTDFENLKEDGGIGIDIREAFAEYRIPSQWRIIFSAGKRLVNWGKGDEVRPLDRICPEDMTEYLFYDKLDRKTGIIGLFSEVAPADKTRLELFWSPYFQRSKTPVPGDYFEPQALKDFVDKGGNLRADQEADSWTRKASAGARFSFPLFNADLSLYGYRGMDPNPTYRVSRFITKIPIPPPFYWLGVPPRPVELEPVHPVVSMLGFDLERTAGPLVLRGEFAYLPEGIYSRVKWRDNPNLLLTFPEGMTKKERLQYLAGVDRVDFIFPRLILNLQYVGEHIMNHEEFLEEKEFTHALTCTLKYSLFESRIEAMWRSMVNMTGGELYNHMEISWRPLEMCQLTLGAMLFDGGRDDYLFGQYDAKDFIFGRWTLLF